MLQKAGKSGLSWSNLNPGGWGGGKEKKRKKIGAGWLSCRSQRKVLNQGQAE